MSRKTIVIINTVAFVIFLVVALWVFTGCSTSKVVLPDGAVILHQVLFMETTAEVVDFYYESIDPNGVSYIVWLEMNDPNRSVNPGKLSVTEIHTGLNATLIAE
jgi:hypothetical protein